MRATKMFPPTLRDEPRDAEAISHKLLLRGGFITQISSGVYVLQPLGLRVLQKVRKIVREEMDKIGCLEIDMPILQPKELWDQSKRWELYEKKGIMFETKIGSSIYGLSPTAEEVVTSIAARFLMSYRQLPLTLYQIKTKFRKEERARFGMIRGREFEMKDAYSFDRDEEGMRRSFQDQRGAYERAFRRMGFDPLLPVEADSGAIGGKGSAEFMAVTESGEDTLITCPSCHYGANREKAASVITQNENMPLCPMHKEYTPDAKTVDDLVALFPELSAARMAKTIIYLADKKPVAVVMRGDRDINDVKLQNKLGVTNLELADPETILRVSGAPVGFAGPIGPLQGIPIYFDESVRGLRNFLCGCNEKGYHLLDVNFGRDLPEPEEYHDLQNARVGDHCAQCTEGVLEEVHGIELGHVFMLQQGYAKSMDLTVLGENGEAITPWMGCYGIGTTRCVQAIIEQPAWRDENGMIWPRSIAPYEVVIVPTNLRDREVKELAERLYKELTWVGIEVVLDDRDDGFGIKIKDADLIGYPSKVIVGRQAKEGRVEMIDRKTGVKFFRTREDVISQIKQWRKEVEPKVVQDDWLGV